ncbi:MAG TPA: PAS domain S-box protein [Pelobium sp.]|nr:PAS domain S-box protein [Pelobium sp.]
MIDLTPVISDSPFAIYTCDKDGFITYYNPACAVIWGRSPELGKDRWCGSSDIFYPDGSPIALDNCPMAMTVKTGKPQENSLVTIKQPNGTFKNLKIFSRPIFNEQGVLNGAHNALIDVTENHEQEVRNAFLSAIVESSDDAIISKGLDGTIKTWNCAAERIFGYTEAEAVGKSILILIPASRRQEEDIILNSIKNGRRVDHFETVRLAKDGREIPISVTISPIKNGKGIIVGASKVARDITEQVRSQELIKKHTRDLEALNTIGKSISEKMDVNLILQRVTDATTKTTGAAFGAFFYNTTNERGESYMLYALSGAPRSAFESFGMPRNTAVFHPTFSGEGIVRVDDITKDPRYGHNPPHFGMPKGHLPVISFLSVPVVSSSGTVLGGLFFGHPEKGVFNADHEGIVGNIASQAAIAIDNSRLFEEVKSLSAKKDEFIALASHELKTPLTSIKGYLQLLSKGNHSETEQRFLKKSLTQLDKLNTLIDDMLDMSRIQAGKLSFQMETFDLKELLLDVIDEFSHTNTTHKIIKELPTGPVLVEADTQRLEQALINLIGNAVKYSPKKENILVSLKTEDGKVTFSVKDYGIGLTHEQRQLLFSRFYRAEGTGNISGLGLGLYLTKQIITRHGGDIYVNSEFGKGSEFSFSLPSKAKEQSSLTS